MLAHFRVSPAVLGPLGAEQLQDPVFALLELIKNSWDADAERVRVSINAESISVDDDGHGMSRDDFRDRWLVIGASQKRRRPTTRAGRPVIGEKGLGRLATFALGEKLSLESAHRNKEGFRVSVDWQALRASASLDEYEINVQPVARPRGTRVVIAPLHRAWTKEHTDLLVQHVEFLSDVPGANFRVSVDVEGERLDLQNPMEAISKHAEARIRVVIRDDGTPSVESCEVEKRSLARLAYRDLPVGRKDVRLAGMTIDLRFLRRTEGARLIKEVLKTNQATQLLNRYQGVRIFREGINVPPYGLDGDDWAGLEKQRTQTGGPTMTPGNSQLVGEVRIGRMHEHLVITAGRAGFTDKRAVNAVAEYVRWAVRAIATARRAAALHIRHGEVPGRVDEERRATPTETPATPLREAIREVSKSSAAKAPAVRQLTEKASELLTAFEENEDTLRLYAQLASAGIAATSFAHELRSEFDVVSWAVGQLGKKKSDASGEVPRLLTSSWQRITSFVALFQVIPVKLRRRPAVLRGNDLKRSAATILQLAPPDTIKTAVLGAPPHARMVPAEFDSVLLNLVSNSIKAIGASAQREDGNLQVSLAGHGADLEVRVADNGCGVDPAVAQIMFEPLEGTFVEGTGMGLPIVKFIAERYGGSAWLEKTPPPGFSTEVCVRFSRVVVAGS